jgi:hypothetical protein
LTRIVDSDGGEDGWLTVQRASVTVAGVAEPSFTSTVQSAGAENGSRSIPENRLLLDAVDRMG